MTAHHRPIRQSSLAVRAGDPLIGIVVIEDGQEITRFFVDEADADAVAAGQIAADARVLAGAWDDLEWEDAVAELDRIRHESVPTPPPDVNPAC